jgi:hypothetical protein
MPSFDEYTTVIDEHDCQVIQPNVMRIPLKDHQLSLIHQALLIESGNYGINGETLNTKIAIMCDKPGAGKSYVILSLLEHDINRANEIMYSSGQFYITKPYEQAKSNLLVVPNGIYNQWINYLKNTTIDYHQCNIQTGINTDKTLNIVRANDYKIMSESERNAYIYHFYKTHKFNRVIFDEVDSINIPNCPSVNASFYWFVSANVKELYSNKIRNKGFIYNQFRSLQYVNRDYLKYLYIRCDNDFINKSMDLPLPKINTIKVKSQVINVLTGIIDTRAEGLIQSNNIREFAEIYNVELTSSSNVINIVCDSLIREKDNHIVDLESAKRKHYSSELIKINAIKRIEEQIKEIDNKIELIRQRITDTDLCPISYEEIVNPAIMRCCKQTFDLSSIDEYLRSTRNAKCPFCKASLSRSQIILVNDDMIEEETKEEEINVGDWIPSEHTREENIIHTIINKCKNNILVFSQYDSAFENMKIINNTIVKQLKGRHNPTETINWINTRTNQKKILLLNARDFGAGLNLEQATDVIIWHTMRSDIENQAICRAQRYGRPDVLNIWKYEE